METGIFDDSDRVMIQHPGQSITIAPSNIQRRPGPLWWRGIGSLALLVTGSFLFIHSQKAAATSEASLHATSGAAVANGGASLHRKMTLAFVTNNASDYWTIARKGTEAAQKGLPDFNVEFVMPPDGTAATQKSMVEELIAGGVKGIAISPVDPTNQAHWLNTVASRVVLITQDSDASHSKRVAFVGMDNHAAGLQCGRMIRKALPRGGRIMLFVGRRDARNAHDREMGIRDALKGSNVQVAGVREDDADHARAKMNVSDVLVSRPKIAGLVGLWSYNGPAILSAVEDAHKVHKVKIVCFDEEDQTLAGVRSGAIYATIVQQPYWFGYDSVRLLAQLVRGNKPALPRGGKIFIPTRVITKANVNAFQANLNQIRMRR